MDVTAHEVRLYALVEATLIDGIIKNCKASVKGKFKIV